MDVGHARHDKATKLELVTVLGDFDGSRFSRPVIDILKEMSVNGLQMSQVEMAHGRAFSAALNYLATFDDVQLVDVENAKFISEYGQRGVEIRISSAHSAASGMAAARM